MTSDDSSRPRPSSTREVPRFAGVPTFLRLPVREQPAKLDVVICGVPFDGGTTYRPGARFGPRAVRQAGAMSRGYNPRHDLDVFERLACADGGDVLCIPMSMERTQQNITARVAEIGAAGAVPLLVGGDHSISLGALRALAKQHGPLGLIHFDAHSDTYGPAWDVDLHHGTVFRHAADEGLLRDGAVLQVGIRGPFTAAADLEAPRRLNFQVIDIDELKRDASAVHGRLAAFAKAGPCYVSFDMDALDPAYAPGTGTPVPGGMTSHEALQLVRALAGVRVVGADVVEISPDHDPTDNTALLASALLLELLGVIASGRPGGSL